MLISTNPAALRSQQGLIMSFLEILRETPYSQVSVAQICRKAQLGRRTFYRNFISKEDLLKSYGDQLVEGYFSLLKKEPSLTSSMAIIIFFTFWKRHLGFLKIVERDGLMPILISHEENFLEKIYALLHNEERKLSDGFRLSFNQGGLFSVLFKWASLKNRPSPEHMADILADLIK